MTTAFNAWQGHRPDSLDAPSAAGGEQRWSLLDTLGAIDPAIDRVIDRQSLRPLLATLPPREQRILAMRFVCGMPQSEIADQIGVSQMHISRLLRHSLTTLRASMSAPARAAPVPAAGPCGPS
ncbi:MAG TPA: sigma-70 family RNA polymerase sigma factor [Kofleriaceae bacterium]|nr:sigma-70 family RNA polymerase sigma factor [Kofleriaceae bacterium]